MKRRKSVLGADSVVEPIGPNVNEGFGLKVEQAASDDSAEEDAMVVSANLAGDLDIKVGQCSGEYRPTLGIVAECKTLERVRVGGEPATEMTDQRLASRGKLIQGESAAGFDPVADKRSRLTATVSIGGSNPLAGPSLRASPWPGRLGGQ